MRFGSFVVVCSESAVGSAWHSAERRAFAFGFSLALVGDCTAASVAEYTPGSSALFTTMLGRRSAGSGVMGDTPCSSSFSGAGWKTCKDCCSSSWLPMRRSCRPMSML